LTYNKSRVLQQLICNFAELVQLLGIAGCGEVLFDGTFICELTVPLVDFTVIAPAFGSISRSAMFLDKGFYLKRNSVNEELSLLTVYIYIQSLGTHRSPYLDPIPDSFPELTTFRTCPRLVAVRSASHTYKQAQRPVNSDHRSTDPDSR